MTRKDPWRGIERVLDGLFTAGQRCNQLMDVAILCHPSSGERSAVPLWDIGIQGLDAASVGTMTD